MKKIIVSILVIGLLLTTPIVTVNANNQIKNITENLKKQNNSSNDFLFDLEIRSLMRIGHFPSLSVCIIKNNSVVWYNGYGRAKFLTKPTINTVYQIGSISKTFTATAMMQLYEKGLFGLDDNINDYLDFEVKNPKYPDVNITFRMLLAHQSSLAGNNTLGDLGILIDFLRFKEDYPYPLIKRMISPEGDLYSPTVWGNFSPGSDSCYSCFNFMLLEHLTEVLSNQSFVSYCKENIFNPLNMSNTSFFFNDFRRNQLATSYQNIGNFYFRLPFIDNPYGVGGIKCSIEDLSHYAIAHMNGGVYDGVRILNESTVDLMHSIQYENSSYGDKRFGLGWVDWEELYGIHTHGHVGHVPGGTTAMWINASNDYAILFSINGFISLGDKTVVKALDDIDKVFFAKAKEL